MATTIKKGILLLQLHGLLVVDVIQTEITLPFEMNNCYFRN